MMWVSSLTHSTMRHFWGKISDGMKLLYNRFIVVSDQGRLSARVQSFVEYLFCWSPAAWSPPTWTWPPPPWGGSRARPRSRNSPGPQSSVTPPGPRLCLASSSCRSLKVRSHIQEVSSTLWEYQKGRKDKSNNTSWMRHSFVNLDKIFHITELGYSRILEKSDSWCN